MAFKRSQGAADEIGRPIDHVQKTKYAFLGTKRKLCLLNDKAQDVTIKKLAGWNPTMGAELKGLGPLEGR